MRDASHGLPGRRPRPLIPADGTHVLGRHHDRLDLTPGITGPWQGMGRQAIPFQEMVKLDYLYVAEWSLWNDIELLLRTVPLLFSAHGHGAVAARSGA